MPLSETMNIYHSPHLLDLDRHQAPGGVARYTALHRIPESHNRLPEVSIGKFNSHSRIQVGLRPFKLCNYQNSTEFH